MNDYDFGNFIYTLRTEKGLSQSELGRLCGVSNKAVSKWEMGAAKPRPEKLAKLAEIFGVTIEELLRGKRKEAAEKKAAEDSEEIAFAIDVLIREYRRAKLWLIAGILLFFGAPLCMLIVLFAAYCVGALESIWAAVLMGGFILIHAFGEAATIVSAVLMVKRKRMLYASFPRRREEVSARSHTVPPAKKRGKLGLFVLLGYLTVLIALAVTLSATKIIEGGAAAYIICGGALAFGLGNMLFTQLWLRRVNQEVNAGQYEKAVKDGKFLLEMWLPDGRAPICDALRLCIAVACFGLYDDAQFCDYLGEITVKAYLPAKSYYTCIALLCRGDKAGFKHEYEEVFMPLKDEKRAARTAAYYEAPLRRFFELAEHPTKEGKEKLIAMLSNPRTREIAERMAEEG